MNNKIFISHADIILDKIYDSNFNLIKQDGGGCNWNDLYNLSLMGETCYAFGSCGNDKEGKIDYNKEVIKFFSKEDLMTLPANKVWDEIQTIRNRQQNLVEIKKEEFLQELDNRGENGRKGTLFARNDGSKFALVRLKNPKYAEVHEYLLAEMDSDGKPNYMNISRIYSEMDLFQPQWRQDVADKLLSQKRVEEKVKNVGGYVGYIDNHHKTYNPALEKLIGNYVR